MGSERDRRHSEKESRPKARLSAEDMNQLQRRLEQLGRRLNRAQPLTDFRVVVNIVRSYNKKWKKE